MKISRVLFKEYTKRSLRAVQLAEKEITIQAPWGKLRGLSWGKDGDPPVFLCHGRMDACSGFRPLLELLPRCFYYVSVDLPGNGRSDHFPRGIQLSTIDFVPTVKVVKEHFKWDKFMYVGHSLGALMGKFFNLAYPGHITRIVELDPVPAHICYKQDVEGVRQWYHNHYHNYYEQYEKLNGGGEAPKYTYEKALEMLMGARDLDKVAAEHVLERVTSPAGDGLYRFTHDQRQKTFTVMPFSGDAYRAIYTSTSTPTFCVLCQNAIDFGLYDQTSFVMDPACWPNGNYSVKIVKGGHDIHISHPEHIAEEISQFLLKGVNAKV
ncbi:serine hydrolase-like protein [Leguminivora glycinivorella]|uniref:serine hydrolase-like protein n=1 Tax=Leguminivora glycinivorella TaxID=1035111 RepID=UPI00200D9FB2|nr:serine hydrolase-like protein [Leguminivora glycinivorella]XP_048003708.1 serine hydrolase-like protein [Leguminivora glycinivorella]